MEQTKEKNFSIRFSGIELLKLFAIFLICISHVVQTSEKFLDYNTLSTTFVMLKLLRHCGQIGNLIFIACSAFYLVDKSKTKIDKIIKILMDSVIISIIIFLVLLIFGFQFSTFESITQFFPDVFLNLSFIPDYIILYLIHPLLNKLCEKLNKKSFVWLLASYAVIYAIICLILSQGTFGNLPGYILLYCCIFFVKKYYPDLFQSKKKSMIGSLLFFGLFIVLTIVLDIIIVKPNYYNNIISVLLIPAVICLFGVFNNMKFYSGVINYLSSCSLFFYCIHENILIRQYIRPGSLSNFYSNLNNSYVWASLIYSLIILVMYYIFALLYKLSFSKLTAYASKRITGAIQAKINKKRDNNQTS